MQYGRPVFAGKSLGEKAGEPGRIHKCIENARDKRESDKQEEDCNTCVIGKSIVQLRIF